MEETVKMFEIKENGHMGTPRTQGSDITLLELKITNMFACSIFSSNNYIEKEHNFVQYLPSFCALAL